MCGGGGVGGGIGELRCVLLCIHGSDRPTIKQSFKEDVKRYNASGGSALMALSLLCEAEDKIFISQPPCVNIREEILQLLQRGVNRAPRRAPRSNLPLCLSVCVHMLMSVAPHAGRADTETNSDEIQTAGEKNKRIKTDGDISRLTVLDI